jgi:hypothetical protein
MKKSILLALMISFARLFEVSAAIPSIIVQKSETIEEDFVKFISKNERKSTYHIQVNQIKDDAERSAFMEGLFESTSLVVVSRPDINGMLKITAPNQFTIEQVIHEVETILTTSKSKPSKNLLKNK